MKRLDRLVLRSFIGPLVLTFAIAIFVLLMQFIWKYVDDMVGKGLEFKIIAELLFYSSATFVPMALPISVLFASIMTMGNFGEKYELIAIKAGGISLIRVMAPMMLVVMFLTGVAFYFSNNVMPAATLKSRSILYDVTRKKPAINIKPGEYYSEINGYVIHINKRLSDGMTLEGITIYDQTQGPSNLNIVKAQKGLMQTSADERYMVFTLTDGCIYSESSAGENYRNRPLTRIGFQKQVMAFDISSFAFSKSDDDFFKGNYRMLNTAQLKEQAAQLEKGRDQRQQEHLQHMKDHLYCLNHDRFFELGDTVVTPRWKGIDATQFDDAQTRQHVINRAQSEAQQTRETVSMYLQIRSSDSEYINRHYIEYHRKFTLPIACLLLFLVGAPFGSIVRKGGLGMPLVASVGFFVLYYVIGTIAEKAVRSGVIGPWGMWISSLVLLPIGVILTIQAASDNNLHLTQRYQHLRDRMLNRRKQRKAKASSRFLKK